MRFVRGFARFWYDFLVGEDWRIAAGVVAALGAGALVLTADLVSETVLVLGVGAAIVVVVVVSIVGAYGRMADT
jgi:hypothetical protein